MNPDGITKTDNVQSMLVQSLYISDVSDKARKQKHLGYLTKQSSFFFFFLLKRNKSIIRNVNKSTGSSTVAISLRSSKDQKRGKTAFHL